MTIDKTKTNVGKTQQREKDSPPGQPTDSANPDKQKRRGKSESKGKTHAKPMNVHKGSSKACNSKTLEREEMDWTGRDWEDGDDNVLRETNPRTSKRPRAHGSLHWTRLSRRK